MTTVYLAGHDNFGNRGCEALVRSISSIVREQIPDAEFLVPTQNQVLDSAQWPEAKQQGIRFVEAASLPAGMKWWNRFRKVLPLLETRRRPTVRLPSHVEDAIAQSDVLVMTGGDVISIDYDLSSLYFYCGFVDLARRLGKPVFLWAASVGPFSRLPHIERIMAGQLQDYDFITVREADSLRYLEGLGVKRLAQVADPAFVLQPEGFDVSTLLPQAEKGVVGINLSQLISKYRTSEESRAELERDVMAFASQLCDQGYGVLFIPHVGPLDGRAWNNDHIYMQGLLERYGKADTRMRLAPGHLNAAQLKYLLAQLRFFIGARTHATIGAISSGVPTISIAYSIKAKGINKEIFGDDRYVLNTPDVNAQQLARYFSLLESGENDIRAHLAQRVPVIREQAKSTFNYFQSLL